MTSSRRIATALLGAVLSTGALLAPAASPAYAVPAPCQADFAQLKGLNSELASLQDELKSASPSQKPAIVEQIREVKAEIAVVKPRYEKCLRDNDGSKPALLATFTGRVTLTTTDSRVTEPLVRDVSFNLYFDGVNRENVSVRSWPTITSDLIQAGPVSFRVTVRLESNAGQFNRSSGRLSLNLGLLFDEDLAWPLDSDSRLPITLGTDQPGGIAMDAAGNVTLAGTSTFNGGHLNGARATLTVTGNVTPRP
ncbi:hypothetical protein EV385_1200 [Krasilnikovia cinnamomea]|uniref:Uncharacterized protein n=1 Tax=Krasilnikovia cinnamomea TaxID=349313 RepID=A0A4Q7ZFA9_9ACTN|nr:hypothetical protein [Krasilnikovia cinnamomea]RZU49450.1 hypothetical protein EV385_1200 [Krasilnikovia cinnamomea]